ncbi:thiazole biosynthesis adenylyltransferase ThiF [Candidatus Aerophobetes bacterium]|uniref:Thiazole biosynthesis adenylyltransferase ThiF n=1 Tax=Aerophobetes bacterium TaxID=2030807 RepID=A0A523TF83_UNCAE|nr:MAG: thiazole biosynthesis adenylyltransferase ThiF [Candidatus Aerophobetes bacterium]
MDLERYSRQILFSRIGRKGQEKLLRSAVIIIGCGALGNVIANNLARAGIGRIKIVDRDFVELSDLQRQILFDEEDVKKRLPKAIAALNKLKKINSSIRLEAEVLSVEPRNIEKLIEGSHLVLDATDNMETRFLINDACVKNRIPWIYGGVIGSTGMSMNIIPEKTPCLRCIIDKVPLPGTLPTCDTRGIINPLPNVIGSWQTSEALKILMGDDSLNQDLIYLDLWQGTFKQSHITKRGDCLTCGKHDFRVLESKEISWVTALCGRNAVQISPPGKINLSLENLHHTLKKVGEVSYNGYLLSFKINGYELIVFPQGRVIIKGTTDKSIARSLCAKYIGL